MTRVLARRIEHVSRAAYDDVEERGLIITCPAARRREVQSEIAPAHALPNARGVANVAPRTLERQAGYSTGVAGIAEEANHVMSRASEPGDDGRTDEAVAARNEKFHKAQTARRSASITPSMCPLVWRAFSMNLRRLWPGAMAGKTIGST